MRRLQPNPTPLPRAERHRRSRAALERRVLGAVFQGDGLTIVARRPHVPRFATLKRWIARDAEFRRRYEDACELGLHLFADDMKAAADRALAEARTERRRAAALRMRLDVLNLWWETFVEVPTKGGANTGDDEEEIIRQLEEGVKRAEAIRAKYAAAAAAREPYALSAVDQEGDGGLESQASDPWRLGGAHEPGPGDPWDRA
jgi:hypothetical protein